MKASHSTQNERLRRVTGRHNALLKELRRAFARGELTHEGYCAIEGVRIVEEAIRSGLRFHAVFFSEAARDRAERLLPQIGTHVETLLVPPKLFVSVVPSETPQGVAALVRVKRFELDDLLAASSLGIVIGVAGVQDPGNLGTILRSAEAFGASGVFLGDKTVSPYNAKVVRASAGSLFRLAVVHCEVVKTLPELRKRGLHLVGTSSHAGIPPDQAQLGGPTGIFIGSEAAGLPRNIVSELDEMIAIPHSPKVESLNAGVAASIVLYEAARQKKEIRF